MEEFSLFIFYSNIFFFFHRNSLVPLERLGLHFEEIRYDDQTEKLRERNLNAKY